MVNLLLKKYLNNNLKTLAKIHKLNKEKGYAYYSDIEEYLNRGRNQVSAILSRLEADNLIRREKDHRPQKIFLAPMGRKLFRTIECELIDQDQIVSIKVDHEKFPFRDK